jgi:hypothetical protein
VKSRRSTCHMLFDLSVLSQARSFESLIGIRIAHDPSHVAPGNRPNLTESLFNRDTAGFAAGSHSDKKNDLVSTGIQRFVNRQLQIIEGAFQRLEVLAEPVVPFEHPTFACGERRVEHEVLRDERVHGSEVPATRRRHEVAHELDVVLRHTPIITNARFLPVAMLPVEPSSEVDAFRPKHPSQSAPYGFWRRSDRCGFLRMIRKK